MAITSRRKKINPILAIIVILLLAAADGYFTWRGQRRAVIFLRPLLLVALLGWFALEDHWPANHFWFGLGLVFFVLGDALFALENYLLAGIVAFVLAHTFYIIGFNPSSIPLTPESIVIAFAVWGAAMILFRRLTAALRERQAGWVLQYPLLFYSLATSIFLLSALVTLTRSDWGLGMALLAAFGGLLLFVADGLLVYDRFLPSFPSARLLTRVAFDLGQLALVVGVLMRYYRI